MRFFITIVVFLFTVGFGLSQSIGGYTVDDKKSINEKFIDSDRIGRLFENGEIFVSKPYPNPAKDELNFSYDLYDSNSSASITISNILGEDIYWVSLSSHENAITIDLKNFDPGIYYYSLFLKEKDLRITRKFLIKN